MERRVTVLVPVFPANAEERNLVVEGVRKGGWLLGLLGRLALLEQRVILAGFMQGLKSACRVWGLEYLAVAGVPEDVPHAPRGALLCLRQLVSAGQLAQDDPVVLFDYRYPLAFERVGSLAGLTGDEAFRLRIGMVPPTDHPVQFEQAYRFEVTEVLRMLRPCTEKCGDSGLPAAVDERESCLFSIINRDQASLPNGEARCFPSAGFHNRIVPARNFGQFEASMALDAVRIRIESGKIRRLDNSRFIKNASVRIVGEPSLRPLRGAPFLAVVGPHGESAMLLVRSSYMRPGLLLKVWPWMEGGFSNPLTLTVNGRSGEGMALEIAGHHYEEAGQGHVLPCGVESFLVAAMLPAPAEEAAEWRERVVPDVPLWGVEEGVVVGLDGTPITCSQQFPRILELCGAVAAGTAERLLGFELEEADPVILEREEAMRIDSPIAALLLDELMNRREES